MRLRFAWLPALLLTASVAQAEVRPHALCSDGMVLQQKAKVHVWGKADKGEKVTVTFRGKEQSATADDQGAWMVALDSGEAGGPLEMTIAGSNTLKYKNVLVGEVWICSGQSNMEWSVGGSGEEDNKRARTAEPNPMLRTFNVARKPNLKPQTETGGNWMEAKPDTVPHFSGVAYFFGAKLQKDLKVPVGLIHTSVGGTRAEAWTRTEALAQHPRFKHESTNLAEKIRKEGDTKTPDANTASALYNGMIAPLLNYTIRGAIWYQGESNAGAAYAYRELFPLMIRNWREDWKLGEFPFFFVQLAPFTKAPANPGESDWAELREAQMLTLKLPNTGMAVITDFGSEYDIHPTPKSPVGVRLALIALAKVYGEKIEYSGPTLRDVKTEGSKMVLTFDHAEGGLVSKELVPTAQRKDGQAAYRVKEGSTNAPVVGFAIAGKDHKWHTAKAEINGNTIIVSSDQVSEPEAVRYGWANHPICNVFNREGLPASPFRTDTYKGKTQRD